MFWLAEALLPRLGNSKLPLLRENDGVSNVLNCRTSDMRIEGAKEDLGLGEPWQERVGGWKWRYICRAAGSPGKVDDSPTLEHKR
jgi:hypothetical protein